MSKTIVLHDTFIEQKRRNTPAVPRYHVVSENEDSGKNLSSAALTFHSMEKWRKEEEDLLEGYTLYEESYQDMKPIIL